VAIGVLLQIFFFILSLLLKLHKYSDFYGTILFDVLGVACLLLRNGEASTKQFVGLAVMILWSTRIAFLLLYRTLKNG
jgi:steroid 5-alpha reductase family enzyme